MDTELMSIKKLKLEKRKAELEVELEQLVSEANRQIGVLQGRIAEIDEFIKQQLQDRDGVADED